MHRRLVSPCSERASPPLLIQAPAGVERALHDFERGRTERQRERELVTLRGHLLPGFPDHFGHFFDRVFGAELLELELQEAQTQGIFHGLSVGVTVQALLEVDATHGVDQRRLVAELFQETRGRVGMKATQLSTPLQVADATRRVGISRDLPAANVLAARGEPQRFGCVRREPFDPGRQALGVDELTRSLGSPDTGSVCGSSAFAASKAAMAAGIGKRPQCPYRNSLYHAPRAPR